MKSGKLNFLEHSGPLRVCNGNAFLFLPINALSYIFLCVLKISHLNSAKCFFISVPYKENSKYEKWEATRMIKTMKKKKMTDCGIRTP